MMSLVIFLEMMVNNHWRVFFLKKKTCREQLPSDMLKWGTALCANTIVKTGIAHRSVSFCPQMMSLLKIANLLHLALLEGEPEESLNRPAKSEFQSSVLSLARSVYKMIEGLWDFLPSLFLPSFPRFLLMGRVSVWTILYPPQTRWWTYVKSDHRVG